MNIGRKDLAWNYIATFLQIGSSVVLLPFVLRNLSRETYAIWGIFATILTFIALLDFGFNPTFARNVSYIFSGAKILKTNGFFAKESDDDEIDFSLLKRLIYAMRYFYLRMALVLFVVLASLGTFYLSIVLRRYSGNIFEAYIAWGIFCIVNTYFFYTLYYDALLQGKGLMKKVKQINVIGQVCYLLIAITLIILRFGLIAIVTSQAISIIIKRILSHYVFYSREIKMMLQNLKVSSHLDLLKVMYPNAVKSGLTSLGAFGVDRSATIVGSLFLTLNDLASFSITMQLIVIISTISTVYFSTYQPRIAKCRIESDVALVKNIYIKSCFFLFAIYIFFGTCLLLFGGQLLAFLGSHTPLLQKRFILLALLVSFLETNHGMAGGIIASRNEIPFVNSSLFGGLMTVILLIVFVKFLRLEAFGMILAPGIAMAVYNNWKWPLEAKKDLKLTLNDVYTTVVQMYRQLSKRGVSHA